MVGQPNNHAYDIDWLLSPVDKASEEKKENTDKEDDMFKVVKPPDSFFDQAAPIKALFLKPNIQSDNNQLFGAFNAADINSTPIE